MISASHILFLRIPVRRHQHFNIFQPSPTSPSPLLPQVLNKRILLNSGHMLTLNDTNSYGVDGGIPGKRGITWNNCPHPLESVLTSDFWPLSVKVWDILRQDSVSTDMKITECHSAILSISKDIQSMSQYRSGSDPDRIGPVSPTVSASSYGRYGRYGMARQWSSTATAGARFCSSTTFQPGHRSERKPKSRFIWMIQDACDCWRFGCQKHLQSSTMFEKRNDDSARMSVKRRPSMQRPIPLQVVKLFLQNLRLEPWSPFNLWRAEPGPRKRSVCPAHPGTPQNWERKHELFKEPKKAYWQSKYWPSAFLHANLWTSLSNLSTGRSSDLPEGHACMSSESLQLRKMGYHCVVECTKVEHVTWVLFCRGQGKVR